MSPRNDDLFKVIQGRHFSLDEANSLIGVIRARIRYDTFSQDTEVPVRQGGKL